MAELPPEERELVLELYGAVKVIRRITVVRWLSWIVLSILTAVAVGRVVAQASGWPRSLVGYETWLDVIAFGVVTAGLDLFCLTVFYYFGKWRRDKIEQLWLDLRADPSYSRAFETLRQIEPTCLWLVQKFLPRNEGEGWRLS